MQVYEVKYMAKPPKGNYIESFYRSLVLAYTKDNAKLKFLKYHETNIKEGWHLQIVKVSEFEKVDKVQARMIIL